jgi:hypothetical protein
MEKKKEIDGEIISIELDICFWERNETIGKLLLYFSFWIKGIKFKCVNPFGPGGGNPVYKITGKKSTIKKWLLNHYGCDEDEADEIIKEEQK